MAKSPYTYFQPDRIGKFEKLNFIARQVVEGFISGLHRSPHRGFSVEFSEHREYTPGDDLRHLDWVAWGRTDRYYIKQYEQETNLRCYILLDVSGSMNYRYGGDVTKFQYGCFLSACLAYLMARQQDTVGMVAFDEKVRLHLPPASSSAHLDRIFTGLETIACGTRTAVAGTFHEMAERIAKRGLIVIVSDLYDDQDEVMRALQHFCYKKHQLIIFHVLDPAELEFPFKRVTNFLDLETSERLQVDPRTVRDAYQREVGAFVERYRKECADRRIEYIVAPTSQPYDLMLLNYLSRRKRLVRR